VKSRDQRLVTFVSHKQLIAAAAGVRAAAIELINVDCESWRAPLAVVTATHGFWLWLDGCGKIRPS